MKSSIKTMFVVLAIVMTFVAVQAVCAGPMACDVPVSGTIDSVFDGGIVVLNADTTTTTVYGIPCYLDGVLEGVSVVITASASPDGKLSACSITIGDVTTPLRRIGLLP